MNKFLKKNGFVIRKLNNPKILNSIKKIIKKYFNKSDKYYCDMPINKFHKLALRCQNEINKKKFIKKFFLSEKKFLEKFFFKDKPLLSSIITLRAVRPLNKYQPDKEQIGWHRETFYGRNNYIKKAMNVWIPINNVNKNNNLRYIPKSHLVEDKKIIRKKFKPIGYQVKRFSNAHKLGFPYNPKKIISGINLKKKETFNVKKNHYLIFSQLLIHGNSINFSKKIRFAINTGMVGKSNLKKNRIIDKRKFKLKSKNNTLYQSFN